MADRLLGATRCAHCRAAAAERTCPSCAASVCPACAADWTTCSEPVGRELRLGVGRRLAWARGDGRVALASGTVRSARFLDLRRIAWARLAAPRVKLPRGLRHTAGRPFHDDWWMVRREEWVGQGNQGGWIHRGHDLVGSDGAVAASWRTPRLASLAAASSGRYAWALARDQGVHVFALRAPYRHSAFPDALPGEVLHSIDADLDAQRAVGGTWNALVMYHLTVDVLEPTSRVALDDGDALWVGLARGRIAAVVDRKRVDTLVVWAIDAGGVAVEQIAAVDYADGLQPRGALSPDGRYVAVATLDHRVLLLDLDARTTTELEGHTDDVCFIGFLDGGRQLITGDCDNRVIIRPRTSSGYAGLVRAARVE